MSAVLEEAFAHAGQQPRRQARAALALGGDRLVALEALCTPNGVAFSGFTALYLAATVLGVWAVTATESIALQLLLSALLGSQLHAITVLQHDCGHRSAYRSPAANLWVGRFLAWFVFMPFSTFTELHRRHHGFLGDPMHDPDEWFYEGGPRQLFVREMLFMPRFIVLSLQHTQGDLRARIVRELAFNTVTHAALVGVLAWHGQWALLAFGYLGPMLWLALVFNPLSRGFEHLPMAALDPADARRRDLRHNTITTTSRLVGVLWANIGFHVEHHMYARVPFWRLPALHRLFAGKAYLAASLPLAKPVLLGDR